jgi:hypothetical protein
MYSPGANLDRKKKKAAHLSFSSSIFFSKGEGGGETTED